MASLPTWLSHELALEWSATAIEEAAADNIPEAASETAMMLAIASELRRQAAELAANHA